ncbi:supervillin-like [Centruroides sculpturatus]|uniref:supervillin-like n=1 Tax=Centruroides sculpturatus TaxID=218467 RepID=UPI000C6ED572|nr:supervillin-like [Centruroides sculpturatus]
MFQKHVSLTMKEIDEGSECKEFWQALGGWNRHMYLSLLDSTLSYDFSPRLFYLNSISGNFAYVEIVCPHYSKKHSCPYPFLQSDLYKAQQPALFLLDNESAVYLWQGWLPEGTEDTENVSTGSAIVRWNNDRRCAMETALHYCQNKCHDNPPKAYLISAGLEPAVFTNLFPQWQQRDDVAISNIKDGKKPGEMLFVQEVLAQLTRMHYPLSELQQLPLPEGVNPSRLESYLTDQDFEEVFRVSKDEFYNLPTWKQCNMKKSVKLF